MKTQVLKIKDGAILTAKGNAIESADATMIAQLNGHPDTVAFATQYEGDVLLLIDNYIVDVMDNTHLGVVGTSTS